VNKVLLTGRLTRDPELRSLASGSSVATFAVATNEFRGNGKEHAEYQINVEVCPQAQLLAGRLGRASWPRVPGIVGDWRNEDQRD
jgi:single-strand DNA-binding protein